MMRAGRLLITTITLVQLVLLPGLLVGWQAFNRTSGVGVWLLQSATIGALLLVMDRLFDWSVMSVWGRYLVRVLFLVALGYSAVRIWDRPLWAWPEGRAWNLSK